MFMGFWLLKYRVFNLFYLLLFSFIMWKLLSSYWYEQLNNILLLTESSYLRNFLTHDVSFNNENW